MQPNLFTKRVAAIPNIVLAPLLMTCVSVLPSGGWGVGWGGVGWGVVYQANVRD